MAKKNTFDGLRSKDHNFSLDTPLYVNTDPWRRNEETDGFPMRDAPLPPPELPPKVSQLPPKSSQLRAIKSPPMGTSTPKSPGELSPSVDVSSPLQLVSCSSQSEIKMPTSVEVEEELLKMEKRCGSVVLDKDEGPIMKKKVTWAPCKSFHRYVKKITGTISTWYGSFLTDNPWVVILINLFFASLLLCGLFINETLNDFEVLMTPNNSVSLKDRRLISELFYEHQDEDYIPSHNPYPPLYAEAIIVPIDEESNMLSEDYLLQLIAFEYFVYSDIELQIQGRVYKYSDLCAKHNTACVKEGLTKYLPTKDHEDFFKLVKQDRGTAFAFAYSINWPLNDGDFLPTFISNTSVSATGTLRGAKALKLRWYLRQSLDTGAYEKSLEWLKNYEEKVVLFANSDNFLTNAGGASKIKITYAMSESLNMLLNSAPPSDTKLFIFSYIFVLVFTMVVSGGTNWVTSRSLLAGVDVVALGMATIAALGMVGMLGTQFVSSVSIMPLLVIGNGLDDLFIFMSAWKKTSAGAPEEVRVSQTLRRAGYPITVSSVASVSAFLLSTFTDFENVNNFCVYSASAVAWCFVVQMTFFGSCLAIHARRVNRYRHCITCLRVKTRHHLQREGEKNPLKLICCAGTSNETTEELDSIMQRFVKHYTKKIFLNSFSKIVCIILYLAYLGASIYGVTKTERGVSLFSIVDNHSPYAQHLIMSKTYFNQTGVPLMLVFTEPLKYHDPKVRSQILQLSTNLQKNELIEDNYTVSWLDKFIDPGFWNNPKDWQKSESSKDFGKSLKYFVENEGKKYTADVIIDEDSYDIIASRFHFQAKSLWSSDYILASDFMVNVRNIAQQSELPAIVFSGVFIYYEQYNYLIKTAVEVLAFSVLALFAISVLIVPSLMIALVMTATVISINLGVLGFMYFWSMKFSIITLIDVILSTAYVMDFAVHICLGYIESEEYTRDERVRDAIESNGVPIFNGALCTSAAISVFAVADSYLFKSFFKICLLVICIGVIHCLLFTPVILSVIGPTKSMKKKPKPNSPKTNALKDGNSYDEDDFPFYERPGFLTKTDMKQLDKDPETPGCESASTRIGERLVRNDHRKLSAARCVSVQTSTEQISYPHTIANCATAYENLNQHNIRSPLPSGSRTEVFRTPPRQPLPSRNFEDRKNKSSNCVYSEPGKSSGSAFTQVEKFPQAGFGGPSVPIALQYRNRGEIETPNSPSAPGQKQSSEFYDSFNSISSAIPSETKV